MEWKYDALVSKEAVKVALQTYLEGSPHAANKILKELFPPDPVDVTGLGIAFQYDNDNNDGWKQLKITCPKYSCEGKLDTVNSAHTGKTYKLCNMRNISKIGIWTREQAKLLP